MMEAFRWIHSPGHTPGHVSLFRDADRTLIVGDAFVTIKQESLYSVITQEQQISGPPRYFTPRLEKFLGISKKIKIFKTVGCSDWTWITNGRRSVGK
ncbi:hypothetical protein BTR23_21210 [Alkalihalophilus pseudofirmus]|nr:hypothetical protein BTR23_21210 [Alkalihalophilus pseudofirmus]